MKQLLLLALVVPLVGGACASSTPAKKHSFTAADYQLDFLEPGKAAERLQPMIGDKTKKILDFIESKLPPLLATLGPAAPLATVAVNKSKPLLGEVIVNAVTKAFDEHKEELEPVMQRYNLFADPELEFELIEEPEGEAKATVASANDVLKRGFRLTRSVRLARKMLAVAKKDAEAIKTAPSATSLAGIGVAGVCITQIAFDVIDNAQSVKPETENAAKNVTNQITSNPLMGVALAPAAAGLTNASAELTTVSADAAGLISDGADLITMLAPGDSTTTPAK